MSARTTIATTLGILAAALAVAAAGGQSSAKASAAGAGATCDLPQGSERVKLNPADFTIRISVIP